MKEKATSGSSSLPPPLPRQHRGGVPPGGAPGGGAGRHPAASRDQRCGPVPPLGELTPLQVYGMTCASPFEDFNLKEDFHLIKN